VLVDDRQPHLAEDYRVQCRRSPCTRMRG
jgi:hypothetical protein